MQTRWIQGLQRWPFTSLQTKATLLVIIIVAGVLALSTFLNIRVSECALERDLRDSAITLAREFAAGISSWEELNNAATLQVDIGQLMEDSPSILGVEVYATAHGVPHFVTSSDAVSIWIPGLGHLSIAGPMAMALLGLLGGIEGAVAGAAWGGVLGALMGWAVSTQHLHEYEEHLRAGKYLVIAHGSVEEVERAHHILHHSGAEELNLHVQPQPSQDELGDGHQH